MREICCELTSNDYTTALRWVSASVDCPRPQHQTTQFLKMIGKTTYSNVASQNRRKSSLHVAEGSERVETPQRAIKVSSGSIQWPPNSFFHTQRRASYNTDVSTGTGIRMKELQREPEATPDSATVDLIWIDISTDLFPRQKLPHLDFRVHNTIQAFPIEYHERFDLVHVCFLSYSLKAQHLEGFVDSVLQILRESTSTLTVGTQCSHRNIGSGGYLQ